ncbi:MAG: sortase [Oscillospiraceae bacterium]|nr:sortase [Oscillospiraceae bacterium]
MGKKHAWYWIGTGTMLLLAALFLVVYNVYSDRQSGKASGEILTALRQVITEHTPETPEEETMPLIPEPSEDLYEEYEQEEETLPPEDPTVELDGRYYVGVLTIPSLNVELPVLREWSYPNLRIAPCRYIGAAAAGDLVIAAHNYSSHFGRIQSLNTGDEILFTDAEGKVYRYAVSHTEMIGGYDVPTMKAGAEDEWDLTLFTCTLSGRSRVSVRAVEVKE